VSYALRATDGSGRSESLAAIRSSVQQAVRLVNQLLMLSAAEAHGPADLRGPTQPLDEIVRQVLEDMAGRAQAKGIDLGLESDPAELAVAADVVSLREIVMNLVDNAIRYAHEGGVVTTRIAADAEHVIVTVEDDGPGIPLEERQRVFERFYRIDDRLSDGCGLGLAIVKEFTARLGGRVSLRTPESGRGIAVDVELPRQPLPA
jgi:two-component system, OmpR family, sensor histidine kinase TctE